MKLSSYPLLVKEWHPTKNGDLTPDDYTHGSDKKVWWVCDKGHSFSTSVSDRTRQKPIGCKYCAGKKASKENNLETLFPEIAKEWHPTKNNDLNASEVTYGTHKKVWWLCSNGHSYEAAVRGRTGKHQNGCPYCSNQSSEPEIRILSEMRYFCLNANHISSHSVVTLNLSYLISYTYYHLIAHV